MTGLRETIRALLGRGDYDEEPDTIPEQTVTEETETKEFDIYEVTAHYQNGDTETFESYGVYSRDADTVTFNVGIDWYPYLGGDRPSLTRDRRTLSYHVLTREPETERVGTETWELRYKRVNGTWQRDSTELERVDRSVGADE